MVNFETFSNRMRKRLQNMIITQQGHYING